MNATLERNPEMTDLAAEMRRLFDEFFAGDPTGQYPPVDIRVTGDEVTLTAELPGVAREDLNVEVDGRHLTLSGEKREAALGDGHQPVHRERRFGRFERTFELGFEVERDKIQADYRNGVLTIRLPKAEAAKPRRIDVQAS